MAKSLFEKLGDRYERRKTRGLLNLKITHSLLIHCLQIFSAEIKPYRKGVLHYEIII
ncbi:MAG: hypothetical protein HFJ09_05730 [Lachnospiraceae bacterium]|nr:hypothetical protein [Lachnospiraceae bacterium]